jgi:hypothetical protein
MAIDRQGFIIVLACLALASSAAAQTSTSSSSTPGYWSTWFDRSDRAKAEQPHWITPLATTTPRLEQELRYDVVWQQPPGRGWFENLGNGKGLELIPADRVEVIVGIPPYFVRHGDGPSGFGDFRATVKYRLAAAPEERGNYIVTAFLDVALPSGSSGNGQPHTVITPTLAYGRGWHAWDVQGTFGAALPTRDEPAIGRTYAWNNALQYRALRRLWPEVEVNASVFEDGRNGGRHQVLLTPGLVVGRLPLNGRMGLTLGAGVQFAVSTFRTSDHNLIVSARLPF